jgi:hypothetical protein
MLSARCLALLCLTANFYVQVTEHMFDDVLAEANLTQVQTR